MYCIRVYIFYVKPNYWIWLEFWLNYLYWTFNLLLNISCNERNSLLWYRRDVTSRFIPPVIRSENDDRCVLLLLHNNYHLNIISLYSWKLFWTFKFILLLILPLSNRLQNDPPTEQIVDERLKHIEPRMIEIITSEVSQLIDQTIAIIKYS